VPSCESAIDSTFSSNALGCKEGKEAYVHPVVEGDSYRFTVKVGKPKDAEAAENGTKLSQGSFRCLMSNSPFQYSYIDDEANAGRMGTRLMATVAKGVRGRVYLPPTTEMEDIARTAQPPWKPDAPSRGTWASNAQGRRYGFVTFGDYFTPRQLVALTTFSDLGAEPRERIREDAIGGGMTDDEIGLDAGGTAVTAYAEAVCTYLGIAISRYSNASSTICSWKSIQ
jgi:putative DNA methylase